MRNVPKQWQFYVIGNIQHIQYKVVVVVVWRQGENAEVELRKKDKSFMIYLKAYRKTSLVKINHPGNTKIGIITLVRAENCPKK